MRNRIAARLLVTAVCIAVANADIYPFMPFGLFACLGLLAAAQWLLQVRPREGQEPPASWRNAVRFGIICSAVLTCLKIGLTLDITIAVQHRFLLNCHIIGAIILVTILDFTDKKANKALESDSD